MRIGTDDDYLRIERSDAADPYSSFVMEAEYNDARSGFHGHCDVVMFDDTGELRNEFDRFASFDCDSLEIPATGGCRLAFSRDHHGNIDVHYRIVYWKRGPKTGLVGAVQVDGEYSQRFLKDIRELIWEYRQDQST